MMKKLTAVCVALAAMSASKNVVPAAVQFVYADYLSRGEERMRRPGGFDAAIVLADEATDQDRLIAFSGRDPSWRP